MNVLFHLGHPAHFHLFKNIILKLKNNGHEITILIKKKDILEDLLSREEFKYVNILKEGRKDSIVGLVYGQLVQTIRMITFCLKHKQHLLIGTSSVITHVGKVLGVPSFLVTEDDAEITPLVVKVAYPFATHIITPKVCSAGKYKYKQVTYSSYHELAYLSPKYFDKDENVVNKYFSTRDTFFIIRLAKLTAHHDKGISGIDDKQLFEIVELLENHGKVYITSERELPSKMERNRISIDPIDIHHVLAFASIYIGDSQTMAAEAAVLGTPFIRFNHFVGKIGYLNELENKYKLGYGFLPENEFEMMKKLKDLLKDLKKTRTEFETRRELMLKEKIDLTMFLTEFIENYPIKMNEQTG